MWPGYVLAHRLKKDCIRLNIIAIGGVETQRSRPRTKKNPRTDSPFKKIFFSGKKRSSKIFLLVLELRSRGFYVQAYADDLAVLVTGADMLWIRVMAQNWSSNKSYR